MGLLGQMEVRWGVRGTAVHRGGSLRQRTLMKERGLFPWRRTFAVEGALLRWMEISLRGTVTAEGTVLIKRAL